MARTMKKLAIAMFVDACGWDVVSERPWFFDGFEHRQPVQSIFGFSSACVPAILTGRSPNRNDHWSCFYYSPETSPFKALEYLRTLPSSIVDRGRVRRYLSKAIAAAYGYTGYFQIYNIPFKDLPLFDYAEKKDIFRPGGINKGPSLADYLHCKGIPHHISNWRESEDANLKALHRHVEAGDIAFAFLYTGRLDALLHDLTKEAPSVGEKLNWYQENLATILRLAESRYEEVRFALFSDHGMATVRKVVNWIPRVERLRLTHGKDYAAIYDSTMMRFWYLNPEAKERIHNELKDCEDARWVPDEVLRDYGAYWADGKFGHGIYALEPGVLLNPSHMGKVPLAGMHGYRPDHPDSDSALVANFKPSTVVRDIRDLYGLMTEMADWTQEQALAGSREQYSLENDHEGGQDFLR